MNMNQSQVPFGVPETGNQKKPGKGLLIACVSVWSHCRSISWSFFWCIKC